MINSSSTHTIAILPQGKMLAEVKPVGYHYGWDNFVLSSTLEKMQYLASLTVKNLRESIKDDEVVKLILASWFPGVETKAIDHQSLQSFPRKQGTNILHKDFVEDYEKFILAGNVVVLGGNDNNESSNMVEYEKELQYPFTGEVKTNIVARKAGKWWILFDQETGSQLIFSFHDGIEHLYRTKRRLVGLETPIGVDLKITNYCSHGCLYCYESSTMEGKHYFGDWDAIAKAFLDNGILEVALSGGEPMMHPDFFDICWTFCKHDVVPSFTTRCINWLKDNAYLSTVNNVCGGFAISVGEQNYPTKIRKIAKFTEGKIDPGKITVQIVLGTLGKFQYSKMVNLCSRYGFRLSLLGFKNIGRGKSFKVRDYSWWLRVLEECDDPPYIVIDSVLASQYSKELQQSKIPMWQYNQWDGKFTCYIDLVDGIIAESSYNKDKGQSIDVDYLSDVIPDFFSKRKCGSTA